MENVNDELTLLLLQINRICYEKNIEFDLDVQESGKNIIQRKDDGGIYVAFCDVDDEQFLEEVTKFLQDLL